MDAKPFFLLHAKADIHKFREKLRTFAIDNDYNDLSPGGSLLLRGFQFSVCRC